MKQRKKINLTACQSVKFINADKIQLLTIVLLSLISFCNAQTKQPIANELLIKGCSVGNVKEIKQALQTGADVDFRNKEGQTGLLLVSKLSRYDLVVLLIDNGATINIADTNKITPLHWVVEYNNVKIVGYLLNRGVDVHAIDGLGETPMHWAAWTGNLDSAKILIEYGGDFLKPNNGGTTPMSIAIRQEHDELVTLFEQKSTSKD